ncbi:MAG: tRNA threonylcarbamoyladenosine dehydratase [Bacteroidales bacterium]|nr:tRNA threonylcarbamoyladenosine dehydratase [Bacteroidales bacterium]
MNIFNRVNLLVGEASMEAIQQKRVIIFGVGGVGSWCAESLVRTGVKHLTIVDCDRVAESNVNRQLMATTSTVGMVKVEVLKQRLLDINPDAEITALQQVYTQETNHLFRLEQYDYIVDCIDSLRDKCALLLNATNGEWGISDGLKPQQEAKVNAAVFSSMGAALKIDPTLIRVAEFWKVRGCPLGAVLRKRMKRAKQKPGAKIMCVYSEEVLENLGECIAEQAAVAGQRNAADDASEELNAKKKQVNGSLVHITAIFGFTLAGLIIKHICGTKDE